MCTHTHIHTKDFFLKAPCLKISGYVPIYVQYVETVYLRQSIKRKLRIFGRQKKMKRNIS